MKENDFLLPFNQFAKKTDDFIHTMMSKFENKPYNREVSKLEKINDFAGYLNLYTTDAVLMMNWYQKVFGYEFTKYRYNLNTAIPLYYYVAQNHKNMPWKINNVKGIILHPAYDESDCIIDCSSKSLGFDWKNHNGVWREPIYKFEYSISNLKALLNNLKSLGIHSDFKTYDYVEQIIYKYHTSCHILTDPRNNTISLWDKDQSYKQNLITQQKTQIDNFFIVHF